MNKKLERSISLYVANLLASAPIDEDGDHPSDYIDNAALQAASEFGVSEDDVRYAADLPR